MTGILLFAVFALWLGLCIVAARVILRRLQPRPWRWLVALIAFVALLILPVADEIVGGSQYRKLCAASGQLRIGVDKPEGRRTRYSANPVNALVPGTAIPVYETDVSYTDVNSGELVVQFRRYVAKGGLLVRVLGISESNAPITVNQPACSPEQERGEVISRTLKFSVVN